MHAGKIPENAFAKKTPKKREEDTTSQGIICRANSSDSLWLTLFQILPMFLRLTPFRLVVCLATASRYCRKMDNPHTNWTLESQNSYPYPYPNFICIFYTSKSALNTDAGCFQKPLKTHQNIHFSIQSVKFGNRINPLGHI